MLQHSCFDFASTSCQVQIWHVCTSEANTSFLISSSSKRILGRRCPQPSIAQKDPVMMHWQSPTRSQDKPIDLALHHTALRSMGIWEVVLYERKGHDLPCHQSALGEERTRTVTCCCHQSHPTHRHHISGALLGGVMGHKWDVYIKKNIVSLFIIFLVCGHCTWHDDEGSLGFHGN